MNQEEILRISRQIARGIFKDLDELNDRCQRIEGKGGKYGAYESQLGGFAEEPFACVISKHLTAAVQAEHTKGKTDE